VLLTVVAVVIAVATLAAFAFRRLALWGIIRYLQARTLAAWRALVAEYLAGRISLDTAAAKYNQIEARFHRYGFRAMDLRPGGPSYLRSISLAPPGYRVDDPRLDALVEHASFLHFGPQRYAEIRAWGRRQREADGPSQPGGPT